MKKIWYGCPKAEIARGSNAALPYHTVPCHGLDLKQCVLISFASSRRNVPKHSLLQKMHPGYRSQEELLISELARQQHACCPASVMAIIPTEREVADEDLISA